MSTANYDQVLAATRATLERIATDFAPAVFASSLAAEDMVLTDLILRAKLPIKIFTLETGRLHAETLGVLDAIRSTYGVDLTQYKPEPAALETYVRENGLNAFYDSVEMRKECCRIRKVEPLNRALAGNKLGLPDNAARNPPHAVNWRCKKMMPHTRCKNLTRSPIGLKNTSGTTSAVMRCPTIRCTTKAIPL